MLSSLPLPVCALVCRVFWRGCIYFRRESGGLSSRSRFPAFLFYFMNCFMLLYFCLACVSLFLILFCLLLLFFFLLFVDVSESTMSSNLQDADPPGHHHLGVLANSLPGVTLAGKASSTTTKYSAIYARWKRWARDHDLPNFPASPYDFALYLASFGGRFPHRVRCSWHCLGSPFRWGTLPFREPVGEGCSC